MEQETENWKKVPYSHLKNMYTNKNMNVMARAWAYAIYREWEQGQRIKLGIGYVARNINAGKTQTKTALDKLVKEGFLKFAGYNKDDDTKNYQIIRQPKEYNSGKKGEQSDAEDFDPDAAEF